jgi:hypothetical protein
VSPRLDNLANAREVLAIATDEVCVLAGVARQMRGLSGPLAVGAVYDDEPDKPATTHVFVHDSIGMGFGFGLATIVASTGPTSGGSIPPASSKLSDRLALAADETSVAKVYRLCNGRRGDPWVELYRIFEVIEADTGGEHALVASGLVDRNVLKRFKHSANSVTVGGDRARHGSEKTTPPDDPMTVSEAERFVDGLTERWVREKLAGRPGRGG